MTMLVGLLVGSLGERSSNRAALAVAESYLLKHGHHAKWIGGLESIPPFSPSDADEAPSAVTSFRSQVEAVDALLVAAPEYAGGVSGVVKNALDWLVGSASIYHASVGVMSVGTTGGEHAIEQLVRTICWQGGLVAATLGVSAPNTKSDPDGRITDPATIGEIHEWADRISEAHSTDPTTRLELVRSTIEPFGIDTARFGELE